MNVALREGDGDAVGVQGVIDALEHVADDIGLFRSICPNEQLEVYAGISHLRTDALYAFRLVYPLVMHVVQSLLYEVRHFLQV